jgi:hypothetical protein
MLRNSIFHTIFVSVFHRILDFKAGLDFYLGPFFILSRQIHDGEIIPSLLATSFFSATK